ncbi:MAG TPA: hypothetical protein VME22_06975 [Solirubrobacteraceae bacterium]|nr:hypothetical protein [Solirubrobacteraceae bacterium]
MRRAYIVAIAVGVVLFLVISGLLARAFSANSAEQDAITSLVKAEAQGDVKEVLDDLLDCRTSPSCRQRAAGNAARLEHPGTVSIAQLTPSTSFSLAGEEGTARVAWIVGGSRPITQCVRVRRTGNVLSGLRVELLAITPRLATDADCPSRF